MEIDLALIFRFRPAFGFSCSCQDGFDHLFPQDEQSGHFPQSLGYRFIASRVFYFMHQVFSAQFLQVIGSLAGGVRAGKVFLYFGSQGCALKPLRSDGQGNHCLQDSLYSGLVDIDACDGSWPNLRRFRPIVQAMIRDESHIHTAQSIQEAVQDFFQAQDNFGEPGQRATAVQFLGIVNNDLNAQDAFVFGIHLGGDLSEVELEDRQVIRRSLEHIFTARFFLVLVMAWTFFGAEDGLQGFDVQQVAGTVNGSLKDLLQFTAASEKEITTVFFLVDRVIVMKVGLFLLGQIQRKAQASRVNPTLTHLAQSPYDVWGT